MATVQEVRSKSHEYAFLEEHKTVNTGVGGIAKQSIRAHSAGGKKFQAVQMDSLSLKDFTSLIHDAAKEGSIAFVNVLLKSHLAPKSAHRLSDDDLLLLLEELAGVRNSQAAIELLLSTPQFPQILPEKAIEIVESANRAENWDVLIFLIQIDGFQTIPSFYLTLLRTAIGDRLIQAALGQDSAAITAVLDASKTNRLLYPNQIGQALRAVCEAKWFDGAEKILRYCQKEDLSALDSNEVLCILATKAESTPKDAIPAAGTYSKREPVLAVIRLLHNLDAGGMGKALVIATERRSLSLSRYLLLQAGNNIPSAMQGACLILAAKMNDIEAFNLFVSADFLKTASLPDLGVAVDHALENGSIPIAKQILTSERILETDDLFPFINAIHPQRALLAYESDGLEMESLFLAALQGGLMIPTLDRTSLPSIVKGIKVALRSGQADVAILLLKKRCLEMDPSLFEPLFLYAINTCSPDPQSPQWNNVSFIKYIVLSDWYVSCAILQVTLIRAFQIVADLGLAKVFEMLEKTARFEEIAEHTLPHFKRAAERGHTALIQSFIRSKRISEEHIFAELVSAARNGSGLTVLTILDCLPNMGIERVLRKILIVGEKKDGEKVEDPFEGDAIQMEFIVLRMLDMGRFSALFTNREDLSKLKKGAERLKLVKLAAALIEKEANCVIS